MHYLFSRSVRSARYPRATTRGRGTASNVGGRRLPRYGFVNNGPDLLGRWGAGTEIGTALFWDRAPYLTTIYACRTSQLRYWPAGRRRNGAAVRGIIALA